MSEAAGRPSILEWGGLRDFMLDHISQTSEVTGDPIPYWKAMFRCMRPLRVIRMSSLQGPFSGQEFLDSACGVHREGMAGDSLDEKCAALWKIERIAFSFCRHGGGHLSNRSMPLELLPIIHTGLGIAVVEKVGLSPDKIRESIDRRADPEYTHFAYESAGCAWGVIDNGAFRLLFETFTGVHFPRLQRIAPGAFMEGFSPDVRPLLSHGYGRTLYFAHRTIAAGIRAATAAPWLDAEAAVHGVAFAYAMINFPDLGRALDTRPDVKQPALQEAFAEGLVLALAMWSWTFPGFLKRFSARSERQEKLVVRADRIVSESRTDGYFAPAGLAFAGTGWGATAGTNSSP